MAKKKVKQWYQSKVLWTNFISLLLGILGAFNADALGAMGITSKQFIGGVGVLNVILNSMLRLISAQIPISGTTVASAAKQDTDSPQ